jgi:hypothetical protein
VIQSSRKCWDITSCKAHCIWQSRCKCGAYFSIGLLRKEIPSRVGGGSAFFVGSERYVNFWFHHFRTRHDCLVCRGSYAIDCCLSPESCLVFRLLVYSVRELDFSAFERQAGMEAGGHSYRGFYHHWHWVLGWWITVFTMTPFSFTFVVRQILPSVDNHVQQWLSIYTTFI